MTKCGGCGKFLSGGVPCTKCKVNFHRQCVNLTTNHTPKNWLCPCCVVGVPRQDNTNTPVKEVAEPILECPQTSEDCRDTLVLQEIRALRTEMNGFRQDITNFRDEVREEIKELRNLYQSCNGKLEGFSERLDIHDCRLAALEASIKETQDLKMQIHNLNQELNEKEQLTLQNDLEISGVTEEKGENVMKITGLIMNKIGLTLDERDIVEACRVGPVRLDQHGKQRPRPIVLRVARRAVHEQVLHGVRIRRNISTGDIKLEGTPRPIYINERLTKENRVLFGRTRTLCKQNNWKFAWVRQGRILIREGDGKPAFRIRREGDLDRFFKQRPNVSD